MVDPSENKNPLDKWLKATFDIGLRAYIKYDRYSFCCKA